MLDSVSPAPVPLDFDPQTKAEWIFALADPHWRIFSGRLYKIMTKDDEHQPGAVINFIPNGPQRDFLSKLHYRNVILKARQLGFTTLIAILFLDHALFIADQRCGMIAQTRDDAEAIFRDKVRFAYLNLPPPLLEMFPLQRDSASELLFAHNNSSIRVGTSMRSGTLHRLHISEMGKIGAKFPERALEIVTGSFPTVPATGITIVESTAEGQDGEFFKLTTRAEKMAEANKHLGPKDFKFHFYPWWKLPEYAADPKFVRISAEEHAYFDKVEGIASTKLNIRQRAWYVAQRDSEFSGDAEKMWREYPSTSKECWQKSIEGTYFPRQMAAARATGRIGVVPMVSNVPVNSYWDIGAGDGTAIWLHQQVGLQHRFIKFIEGWSEPYGHFINLMEEMGCVWGQHYLPHDAEQKRQAGKSLVSPLSMLQELRPQWHFEVVPQIGLKTTAIQLLRSKFQECWFDEEGCKEGLVHLDLYHKTWNRTSATWTDIPYKHDGHSEAADALMGFAQSDEPTTVRAGQRPNRRR